MNHLPIFGTLSITTYKEINGEERGDEANLETSEGKNPLLPALLGNSLLKTNERFKKE